MGLLKQNQDFSPVEDAQDDPWLIFPLPCPSAPHTQCWLEIPVLQEQLEKYYEHDKIKNGFQLYVTRIPKNVSWKTLRLGYSFWFCLVLSKCIPQQN